MDIRADQAAARAVIHLERYLDHELPNGDRRELERALDALLEALDAVER